MYAESKVRLTVRCDRPILSSRSSCARQRDQKAPFVLAPRGDVPCAPGTIAVLWSAPALTPALIPPACILATVSYSRGQKTLKPEDNFVPCVGQPSSCPCRGRGKGKGVTLKPWFEIHTTSLCFQREIHLVAILILSSYTSYRDLNLAQHAAER